MVPIERKHLLPAPVRTRVGVGEAFIDHAAGMPLRARESIAPAPPVSTATYATPAFAAALATPVHESWYAQANADALNPSHEYAYREYRYVDDEPVDLPLRPHAKSYAVIAALVAAFVVVLVSVVLAGSRMASSGSEPETHPYHQNRTQQVGE